MPGLGYHRLIRRSNSPVVREGEARTDKEGTVHVYHSRPECLPSLQTNGIFELQIKNSEGKVATWTIDMKKTGEVYLGPAKPKADVTLIMDDATFVELASGKVRCCSGFNLPREPH